MRLWNVSGRDGDRVGSVIWNVTSYNNAPNATTGVSPFFANKGYDPAITIHPQYELASSQAHKFITDLSELHKELWKAILLSQEHYQHSADKHRIPPPDFKVGDQVFVKAKFFHTTHPTKKFSEKYLGPYEIINQAGPLSWTLRLPDSMHAIHPIFHVSMLEPSTLNSILNLLCHQYSLMVSLNMKSQRFSTLNWITDAVSVNSYIWSGGLDMKVPMKKPLGYPPTNLLTLPTLSPISIPNILPNLALFPFNKICLSIFIPFCYVSIFPPYRISSITFSVLFHLIILFHYLILLPLFTPKNKVKKKQKTKKSIQF